MTIKFATSCIKLIDFVGVYQVFDKKLFVNFTVWVGIFLSKTLSLLAFKIFFAIGEQDSKSLWSRPSS